MVSKKINKNKALVAIIVCITMISMIFLTSCQSKDDIDPKSVFVPESETASAREQGVQSTTRTTAVEIDSLRTVAGLPQVTLDENGGVIEVTAETDFIFTPANSGMWYIYTSDNGDDDPYLCFGLASDDYSIVNDDDSGPGLNAYIAIELEAGVTYSLHTHFYADEPGRYLLTVTQEDPQIAAILAPFVGGELSFADGTIITDVGDIMINGRTELAFSSSSTMAWSIWTSGNGDCDPYLELYDSAGNRLSYRDDINENNVNAYMQIFLESGESYTLRIGFWDAEGKSTDEGECTLNIRQSECILFDGSVLSISGGGILSVIVPDVSGTWEFRTTESGECDPYLRILDRNGEIIIEDDDSAGGNDALITVELIAGVPYLVRVTFYQSDVYETKLVTTFIGQ